MTQAPVVRSIERAADVLLTLTHGPQRLARIAVTTGLSKTTVHRVLASLSHKHLVMQGEATGEYMLGPACFSIADAVARGVGGIAVATRPLLARLNEVSQETVTLHIRSGRYRVCVEELPSPQAIRYTAGVGAMDPIHVGSAGKLLLAFSEPDQQDELLRRAELESVTEATITDPASLRGEIAMIRARGYAASRGERVRGAAAITAPVLWPDGRILAALSILGPEGRLTTDAIEALRPPLLETAQEISNRLSQAVSPASVSPTELLEGGPVSPAHGV